MIRYLACVAGGMGIGYYAAHKKLEQYFEERLDKETQEAQDFYRQKYEKKLQQEIAGDPEFLKAAIDATEAMAKYQGIEVSPSVLTQELTESFEREEARIAEEDEDGNDEEEAHDLIVSPSEIEPGSRLDRGDYGVTGEPTIGPDEDPFESTEPEPTDDAVTKVVTTANPVIPEQAAAPVNYNRVSTPEKKPTTAEKEAEYSPSVMKREDFIDNLSDYKQSSYTYFAGDDILAGEEDEVIPEGVRLSDLGDETIKILKAGPEAFGGADALYVQNDHMTHEFEIIWNSDSYVNVVGPITASG